MLRRSLIALAVAAPLALSSASPAAAQDVIRECSIVTPSVKTVAEYVHCRVEPIIEASTSRSTAERCYIFRPYPEPLLDYAKCRINEIIAPVEA